MRFLFLLLLLPTLLSGQSLERARKYIDTLTSPGMHGRGAEFSGDSIAAVYLASQFENIGLSPVHNSYFQQFKYNINTFPGELTLKVGNCPLIPGKEFIVESGSKSGKGAVKLVRFDTLTLTSDKALKKFLTSDLSKKGIVINSKTFSSLYSSQKIEIINKIKEAAVVVELEKKLTAGLSQKQGSQVHFKVLETALPESGKKISYHVDAELKKNYKSQNVVGIIKGKTNPDSVVLISAHYDHLGRMGRDIYFPGANDNASGVSMLLELAQYYAQNPPDFSIAFIAFGAEEAGLIGSNYFVRNPMFPLDQIKFMINLDLLGTGEDGIMVVNGAVLPEYFLIIEELNKEKGYLKEVKKRGKAANSDHYFFYEAGVPAFFIYTLGGIAAYHDVFDVASTLPLTEFQDVFKLITDFISVLSDE